MFGTVVSLIVIAVLGIGWFVVHRIRVQRYGESPYTPNYADIELNQAYGAWDAAGTPGEAPRRTGGQGDPDHRPLPTSETRGWDLYRDM